MSRIYKRDYCLDLGSTSARQDKFKKKKSNLNTLGGNFRILKDWRIYLIVSLSGNYVLPK